MGQGGGLRGLLCPGCGSRLEPLDHGTPEALRLCCPGCGETYRARRRDSSHELPVTRPTTADPPPLAGSFSLFWRGFALRVLECAFYAGTAGGAALFFVFGGFVPVVRRWLADEVANW